MKDSIQCVCNKEPEESKERMHKPSKLETGLKIVYVVIVYTNSFNLELITWELILNESYIRQTVSRAV